MNAYGWYSLLMKHHAKRIMATMLAQISFLVKITQKRSKIKHLSHIGAAATDT